MIITCTARKSYTLTTDAPSEEALVNLAEELMANGLDSHDLGDAMGAFCTLLDEDMRTNLENTGQLVWVGAGDFTVTISYDVELFEWQGL